MRNKIWTGAVTAIGMLLVILDTRTATEGAKEGLELCVTTVIPSLFPFFVLSILLTGSLTGLQMKALRPLGRLCRIPYGSEALLLIGVLGGYPTGAQAVTKAYRDGQLERSDARRMLGFCSNAGPAFLFGIVASAFSNSATVWALWIIHIVSALAVGVLLPGQSMRKTVLAGHADVSLPGAMEQAVKVMARVCGWIVLFRVIMAFLRRWFLWMLSAAAQTAVAGLLELTIGCMNLPAVENDGLRFILCAALLSFGGVCVAMQTVSVTGELGTGMYFPGKVLQCVFSVFLAALWQYAAYGKSGVGSLSPIFFLGLAAAAVLLTAHLRKKEKKGSNSVLYGV